MADRMKSLGTGVPEPGENALREEAVAAPRGGEHVPFVAPGGAA
jgi:hypothetical protein